MSPNRTSPGRRFERPERLLPFACIAAAAVLFASELATTFQFVPPGGQPVCTQQAADRHHFALGVLAIFAVGAVIVAVLGASKPAAIAVAVCGVAALLLFVTIDLPKVDNLGTVGGSCTSIATPSFSEAKAVPQAGFWLEMVGALALALSGAALATLTPDQLASLRPRRVGGPKGPSGPKLPTATPLSSSDPRVGPGTADAGSGADVPADQPARARGARRR